MLIPISQLNHKYKLNINGILHIGAHKCEELPAYFALGLEDHDIVWIEGNKEIAEKMSHISNVFNEIISDVDGQEYDFIVTNNYESSSILELDEHKKEHPHVRETDRYKVTSITVDSFYKKYDLVPSHYNFVNIDIQGAELMALKGMANNLTHVDYLYLEVNIKHLYKNCALVDEIDSFLDGHGFRRVETKMTKYGWGDAFYVRKEMSS